MINPNGSKAAVEGRGTVEATMTDVEGVDRIYSFKDVLYVPSYSANLMNVSPAEAKSNSFILRTKNPNIQCGKEEELPRVLRDKFYHINWSFNIGAKDKATRAATEAELWHR